MKPEKNSRLLRLHLGTEGDPLVQEQELKEIARKKSVAPGALLRHLQNLRQQATRKKPSPNPKFRKFGGRTKCRALRHYLIFSFRVTKLSCSVL